ncbi:helix-turn-helix transcriptional regulator [Bacillus solimangrovi]|uniref:Transcriptional regulator n=1 Tax=Bacillus solimangrovi TaxID=1305675 RepID=A0A1E5LFM2_9BACI|nr:helix-turn-helix domain-containing protein [Bacillus solimangrovi]OEH92888.1 transcriptional regulator [Bacillus solimangrovi]
MEQTLKITNVLSDPTRYSIYQYITKKHQEVTVQEIADAFEIHPNVARLHLSKLEDVNMLVSETKKTGKGGRPSRLYRLSDDVIQLNFPFRDYQLLSKIAMDTLMSLGDVGKKALFETGKQYGVEVMNRELKQQNSSSEEISFDESIELLKNASATLGFYPDFSYNESKTKVNFQIHNCPFKEVAKEEKYVCDMHYAFLSGMFNVMFTNAQLVEEENMLNGCDSCKYQVMVTK